MGITASHATISLRITATGDSDSECDLRIGETVQQIESKLGSLVFGANGVQLEDVVIAELYRRQKSLTLMDYAFGGIAAGMLHEADREHGAFLGGSVIRPREAVARGALIDSINQVRAEKGADYAVAVSQLYRSDDQNWFDVLIAESNGVESLTLQYGGHSGLRKARTAKQIINAFRLYLMQ